MESRDLKDSEQKRYFVSSTVEAMDMNEKAVERAKHNYELEMEEKGKHSYSMVFKMFE